MDAAGRLPNVFFSGAAKARLTTNLGTELAPIPGTQIWERDPVGGTVDEGAFSAWNPEPIYNINDIVTGSDELFYISITNANQNNDPTVSSANWTQIRFLYNWNSPQTYNLDDVVIGTNGQYFRSAIASNQGNDPILGDQTKWRSISIQGDFYVDSGVADAYDLAAAGFTVPPSVYEDGERFVFYPTNTNTGASTLDRGPGVIDLVDYTGAALVGGEVVANEIAIAVYDAASGDARLQNSVNTNKELINDLLSAADKSQWPTISNGTDTAHDIDFGAGNIGDSTGSQIIKLASVLTKQIDAAWAEGTNLGGLFSGTVAANTGYHCFLIVKDSDGTIDGGFDTSFSAANIPIGYTSFRRIGSVVTNSSSDIRNFIQNGDDFKLLSPVQMFGGGPVGSTSSFVTFPCPPNMEARYSVYFDLGTNGTGYYIINDPNQTDIAASATNFVVVAQLTAGSSEWAGSVTDTVFVDSSRRARHRASSASNSTFLLSHGWIDQRVL